MAEVDPVILELRVNADRYLSAVRSSTTAVEAQLGRQQRSVAQLESQFRSSTGVIRTQLAGLAGSLAALAGGDRLVSIIDDFTQFQNKLKVAGVEAANLGAVQDRLFASAQKYGVGLGELGGLFGSLTQASKELGATQQDVFKLTDAVSAALKVSGSSAGEAAGALQQLGQALRSPTVQAEEYNSLLDGLFPLLQAAADGSDKYAGSVGKLTAAVKAGQVTSREFFQLVLTGAQSLEQKASTAVGTVSQAYTQLGNAITVYVGQAATATGVQTALTTGLSALAENLDLVANGLAVIATSYLGVKAGQVAFAGVTAATARALDTDRALASQIVTGNASYVSRSRLTLAQAAAAREAAASEVAGLQSTLAARRADQAAIAQTLALIERQQIESAKAAQQQRFNSQLNFGLGRAVTSPEASRAGQDARSVITTRAALAGVNAQVTATENALAAAQGRVTVASATESAAIQANTLAKRAGAAATTLLAGTGAALGAALPFIAIAAVTTALLSYKSGADTAREAVDRLSATIKSQSQDFAVLKAKQAEAAAETNNLTAQQRNVLTSTASLTGEVGLLATAWGRVAASAKSAAVEQARAAFAATTKSVFDAGITLRDARRTPADQPGGGLATLAFSAVNGGVIGQSSAQRRATADAKALLREALANREAARAEVRRVESQSLASFKPSVGTSIDSKALARHQATLAGLRRRAESASGKELKTVQARIRREEAIIADLSKGVSQGEATAAAPGASLGGNGRTKKLGKSAAEEAAELLSKVRLDLNKNLDEAANDILTERERLDRAARTFQNVFGTEGKDYENPFKGVEPDKDRQKAESEARDDAERQSQTIREDNVRSLADLYTDLFTQSTGDIFENFKRQGLRAVAIVLAQATIKSFGEGGGGFGSLLKNIGAAASKQFGSVPGRASGGFVGAGQLVRVNEGASPGRVEGFRPVGGGEVIPLGRMARAQSGNVTIVQHISVDSRNSVTPAGFASEILNEADRRAGQAIGANNSKIRKGLPAAQSRFNALGTT